ncbi:MAG: HAD family hydrolase [Blautia sp.]|nr:HAD family hydrolase [Blautia sp.]MDY3998304.1 HAD family hydrolase [Blautia sp.]
MDSIIFDVDGTLWDSTDIVAKAWTQYLREKEHMEIEITSKRLMSLFGQLLPDISKALFPELSASEQLRIIEACCQAEHEALCKECAPLYEDLEKTLQILSQKFPLFIVSNCQAGYIEVFLKATGFGKYFKGHLCPGDTGMAKAENISRIVRDFQLSSPVYVGDTMGDYQACKKAGVPFIFAAYGFGDVPAPYAVIQKPMDLIPLCIPQ